LVVENQAFTVEGSVGVEREGGVVEVEHGGDVVA